MKRDTCVCSQGSGNCAAVTKVVTSRQSAAWWSGRKEGRPPLSKEAERRAGGSGCASVVKRRDPCLPLNRDAGRASKAKSSSPHRSSPFNA